MSFGDFKITVPKFAHYKNKDINTLTRTNIPTRRKGEQSIRLIGSSKTTIPHVQINIDTHTHNMKIINKTIKEIQENIKNDVEQFDRLIGIKQKNTTENEQAIETDDEVISNVLTEMYNTDEYKQMKIMQNKIANKKSSSNKYKIQHSTYTSMLHRRFIIEWLVKHKDKLGKLNIKNKTTDEEDRYMAETYENRNKYIVGFNAGSNQGHGNDMLINKFVRFVITHGNNTMKIINKQLKMINDQIVEKREKERQIDTEHRIKMATDQSYREKENNRIKDLIKKESIFL